MINLIRSKIYRMNILISYQIHIVVYFKTIMNILEIIMFVILIQVHTCQFERSIFRIELDHAVFVASKDNGVVAEGEGDEVCLLEEAMILNQNLFKLVLFMNRTTFN